MEIDSNSCTVSEKWARDHMEERSLNRPPDCLCLCSSVGEMSVYTLWICLHISTIGMNWCLYDRMSCMYILCMCWSKEENRNKSQQKWWTEHCWSSQPPCWSPEHPFGSQTLSHCVHDVQILMSAFFEAQLNSAPTEEPLSMFNH